MDNPYEPPHSIVRDVSPGRSPGWLRLIGSVLLSAAIGLVLAWNVAPWIAGLVTHTRYFAGGPRLSASFLLTDEIASFIFFFASSFLATVLAGSRPYVAALGVSFFGWLVYFVEVGGLQGMLNSTFPWWYEFPPTHLVSGLLAGLLAARRRVHRRLSAVNDST
jgi:hypothetical protein